MRCQFCGLFAPLFFLGICVGQSIGPLPAEPVRCLNLAPSGIEAACAVEPLPDAPEPPSGIDLSHIRIDPALYRHDPTTRSPKVFDTQFIVDHSISYAALVFDAEAEIRFEKVGGAESNPLLGSRPGRLRIYGTMVPIQAALGFWDWIAKRNALATPREIGEDSSVHFPTWRVMPYVITVAHLAGGAAALTETCNAAAKH